jgi:16S rRNA (guanine(1405)-N(7))-methyltransferase
MSDLSEIVAAVGSSKKYRAICEDTVRRIAARELASHRNHRAAVKATKRRLHQVYGAFEREIDYNQAYQWLEAAYTAGSGAEIRAACRRILALHSSTRERLPILEELYDAVFEITGRPLSLLDLGCGLNPLALPWMGLEPGVPYVALDIDADRVRFLNRYLALAGHKPLARCQDLLSHPPDDEADLALLLKTGPSLERQEPGATLRVIEQLQTRSVVVSFAVKSLGGREKGMMDQYGWQFYEWAERRRWPVKRVDLPAELVFVVVK